MAMRMLALMRTATTVTTTITITPLLRALVLAVNSKRMHAKEPKAAGDQEGRSPNELATTSSVVPDHPGCCASWVSMESSIHCKRATAPESKGF